MARSQTSLEDAFETLLERHGAALERMIRSLCPPSGAIDPEEVKQDVRLRLWRAVQSERILERPASYLYRVATTATIDAVRRLRARREEPLQHPSSTVPRDRIFALADPRPGPEHLARSAQLGEQLARSIDSLADNRRMAVKLHLQGFTTIEIGELLGWSEAKARNLVSRGLKELRSRLVQGDLDRELV